MATFTESALEDTAPLPKVLSGELFVGQPTRAEIENA